MSILKRGCSDPDCIALLSQLRYLAKQYPETKFISIPGSRCIEGYPDRLQPTLILYRGGDVVAQVVSWGKDRKRESPGALNLRHHNTHTKGFAELEALLVVSKVVHTTEKVIEDRRDESDDDQEDNRNTRRAQKPGIRSGRDDNRKVTVEDEDSDFDI